MNPYAGNPGDDPPPGADPNQTRYFPTQGEAPAQASPQSEYTPPPNGGHTPPTGFAPPNTGYAPPSTGAPPYQPPPRTGSPAYTVPAVRGERDRMVLGLILIVGGLLFLLGNLPFFPDF